MKRNVRKLGKQDFQERLQRVDGHFAKHGYAQTIVRNRNERPYLWTIIGFIWIFFVVSIAENRAYLETSLAQGSLPAAFRDYVFYALTGLVVISVVALGFHLLRFLFKKPDFRGASGSLLAGALGAVMLTQLPPALLQDSANAVFGTGQVLAGMVSDPAISAPDINISNVNFVSGITD